MSEIRPARGEVFNGRFRGTVSTGTELELYSNDTLAPLTIGPDDQLYLQNSFLLPQTSNYGYLLSDDADLVQAASIVAATDTAGGDSLTIAGDYARQMRAGRLVTIANSTNNDGQETTTGATYDADTDQTTITFAAGTLTSATADGDLTADITLFEGLRFMEIRGAANVEKSFGPEGTPLPRGHRIIIGQDTANVITAIARGYIVRG